MAKVSGYKQSKIRCAVCAALAAMGVVGSASANSLDDAANGQLNAAATWGGTAPVSGDTLTINSNTVSVNATTAAAIAGHAYTINLSGTGKFFSNYDTSIAATAILNLGGGTYEHDRGTQWSSGVTINVAANTNTIYYTSSNTEVSGQGGTGTQAVSAVVTGSGTITKTGYGILSLNAPADTATVKNASTFNGTYDVQSGLLQVSAPEFTKYATVKLSGTVAGTIAGTGTIPGGGSTIYPLAPRLNYANGGVPAATQLEVMNLLGTGRVSWNGTSSYYRDVAVGGLLDPGTATEAGLIKRDTAANSNDLVMRPGSTMAFDIFSATSADQVDWSTLTVGSSIAGMVFNEAALKVRLFTPTDSTGPLSWTLIVGDEWISKSSQGSSPATAIQDQAFASISYLDAAGGTLNLYTGVSDPDGGWKNLAVSYPGTMGSSDRKVVLSGEYVAVPEPAGAAILVLGGLGLASRRRRRA